MGAVLSRLPDSLARRRSP
jgi:hypothetical protein